MSWMVRLASHPRWPMMVWLYVRSLQVYTTEAIVALFLRIGAFGQVQVSLYEPDGVVAAHMDHRSYDEPIAIALFFSSSTLRFGDRWNFRCELDLELCSISIVFSKARALYAHGIDPRIPNDLICGQHPRTRINLTLHNVKPPAPVPS